MVCPGTDDTDVKSIALVPASESIDDVNVASSVKVVDGALSVDAPDLRRVSGLERNRVELNTSGLIGLLTSPHQILFCELSSFTIRLSNGDLPVLAPEYAARAPEDTIAVPVS